MFYENVDRRLVMGDVASISATVKDYLKHTKFGQKKEGQAENDIREKVAIVKGFNLQRSVIRLLLSSSPQLVSFLIRKESDKEVRIEIKFDLFLKFRIFYYSVLAVLLSGFGIFLKKGSSDGSLLTAETFSYFSISLLISVMFLMLAFVFFVKLLKTAPYESFINEFYADLSAKGFLSGAVLRHTCNFPDIWRGLFVFAALIMGFLIDKDFLHKFSDFFTSKYVFFPGIIIILGIILILAFVMFLRPVIATRLLFCIIGIGLCLPVAIFGNAPLLNLFTRDIVEKVDYANKNYLKRLDETVLERPDASDQLNKRILESKKILQTGTMIVVCYWIFVACLLFFLFWHVINLPVKIMQDLGMFNTRHPESLYHKALQPEESSKLFGAVIVLLWVVMSTANFAGLYFSLSIFEKLIFNSNHVFKTDIGAMFFVDTKTLFSLLLQSPSAIVSHKLAMFAYSIPMTLIFSFVLVKNLKSFTHTIASLKSQGRYGKIEEELEDKVHDICRYAGVSKPVIKSRKSSYISSETEYLGFPFFKNILIITDGAWEELKDKDGELDALLAHEIWHQKKHTFKRKLLCLLSDYTLFGNGFLALLQNSFLIEREADAFARRWLQEKLKSKEEAINTFKSLLSHQRTHNGIVQLKQTLNADSKLSFGCLKDNAVRERVTDLYNKSSNIIKIWLNIKLLFQMYFGNEILSYFHPPYEQRKAWIES